MGSYVEVLAERGGEAIRISQPDVQCATRPNAALDQLANRGLFSGEHLHKSPKDGL